LTFLEIEKFEAIAIEIDEIDRVVLWSFRWIEICMFWVYEGSFWKACSNVHTEKALIIQCWPHSIYSNFDTIYAENWLLLGWFEI
jgi:hypothetical protein